MSEILKVRVEGLGTLRGTKEELAATLQRTYLPFAYGVSSLAPPVAWSTMPQPVYEGFGYDSRVQCSYCKRTQERPKEGQCLGCGAPL